MVLTLSPMNFPIAAHEASRASDDTSSNPDETAGNLDDDSSVFDLDRPTVGSITAQTPSPMNSPMATGETSQESMGDVLDSGDKSPTPESSDGNTIGVSSMTAHSLFNTIFTDGRSWELPPEGDSCNHVEGMKANLVPSLPGRTQQNHGNLTDGHPVCSGTSIIRARYSQSDY